MLKRVETKEGALCFGHQMGLLFKKREQSVDREIARANKRLVAAEKRRVKVAGAYGNT
jgi:hypothetical protein